MIAQAEAIDTLEDIATKIECVYAALSVGSQHYVQSVFEMGRLLHHANEALARKGNGTFCRWVEQRLSISRKTAQNYMNAWRRFHAAEFASLVRLGNLDAIYELTRQSDDVAEQAVRLTDSGKRLTLKMVNELDGSIKPSWFSAKAELLAWSRRHEETCPDLVDAVRNVAEAFE